MKAEFVKVLKDKNYLEELKNSNEELYKTLISKLKIVKSTLKIKDDELAIYYLLEFLQYKNKLEFGKFPNMDKGTTYFIGNYIRRHIIECSNIGDKKWDDTYDWIRDYLYRVNLKKLLKE